MFRPLLVCLALCVAGCLGAAPNPRDAAQAHMGSTGWTIMPLMTIDPADPTTLNSYIRSISYLDQWIPAKPGLYFWISQFDNGNEYIDYLGATKNLRNRIGNDYFTKANDVHGGPRIFTGDHHEADIDRLFFESRRKRASMRIEFYSFENEVAPFTWEAYLLKRLKTTFNKENVAVIPGFTQKGWFENYIHVLSNERTQVRQLVEGAAWNALNPPDTPYEFLESQAWRRVARRSQSQSRVLGPDTMDLAAIQAAAKKLGKVADEFFNIKVPSESERKAAYQKQADLLKAEGPQFPDKKWLKANKKPKNPTPVTADDPDDKLKKGAPAKK